MQKPELLIKTFGIVDSFYLIICVNGRSAKRYIALCCNKPAQTYRPKVFIGTQNLFMFTSIKGQINKHLSPATDLRKRKSDRRRFQDNLYRTGKDWRNRLVFRSI